MRNKWFRINVKSVRKYSKITIFINICFDIIMTATETTDGCHELTETVSEYKWTLYNFSSFNEPTGKCIDSPTFLSNGIKWCISLYPNGDEEDYKEYISLYLCRLDNFKITVDYEFIVSNSIRVLKLRKLNYTFPYDEVKVGFGWGSFCTRSTILVDFKDKNDILNIIVKMSFSTATQETNHLNQQQEFGSLLKTREYTDVILVSSDGSEHKAHKAILACRSKVFSAMFQHNMKESQDNIVEIEDVDSETLAAMLYFVYTGELVPIAKDISKKLLIASDKYEFTELKRMCIKYLDANMNNDNVLDLIKLADTYNINELKLIAKKYFLQNHKKILSIESREKLRDLPRDIIEVLLCDLSAALSV